MIEMLSSHRTCELAA